MEVRSEAHTMNKLVPCAWLSNGATEICGVYDYDATDSDNKKIVMRCIKQQNV